MPDDMVAEVEEYKLQPRIFEAARDVNRGALLIAGCDYNQTSADALINGKYQGAATYALNLEVSKNPDISYYDLVRNMNTFMTQAGFTQRPQLNGAMTLHPREFLEPWATTQVIPPAPPDAPGAVDPQAPTKDKDNTMRNIFIAVIVMIGLALLISN